MHQKDVILFFDANGKETLKFSYDHLCPGGKLVVYGFHSMLPKYDSNYPSYSGALGTTSWVKMAYDYLSSPTFDPMKMTTDCKSVLAFNLSFFIS